MPMVSITPSLENLNQGCIQISDPAQQTQARIDLEKGGSVQELVLKGIPLIQEQPNFPYSESYASALLFPFVNRLEAGRYEFEGQAYQLPINHPKDGAAHHGLVYNQAFRLSACKSSAESAELVLAYDYAGQVTGFPFPFSLEVVYQLSQTALQVKVTATNTGESNFPFGLGWHPYFLSQDRDRSSIRFQCQGRIETNEQGIGRRWVELTGEQRIDLKDRFLDDAFDVTTYEVELTTPGYRLRVQGQGEAPFYQIYTPPHPNLIAVEPTVGVTNSFNHGVGLQVLAPGAQHSETWRVQLS